jgi:hypothetical protein
MSTLINPTISATNTQEAAFSVAEVRELAKNSLDFLAGLALPTIYRYAYPPVLLSVWDWLISNVDNEREFPQLALGIPRGFSKTTLMKIFALYCILFTNKKFILVVCSTATHAESFLSDVADMLEEPNIKAVFGDWKLGIEKDTQDTKKFGFMNRNIILKAIGSGTSARGINSKHERPDVILMDDVQTYENAESKQLSEALETWMLGTLMKAKSPFGCTFLFVGNMYRTTWSILKKLKSNPNWTKFICGGILSDNTSLWEELHPRAQLQKEFQNDLIAGRPEIFFAEVLNDDTITTNTLINLSKLPPLPCSDGDIPSGKFIVIDPATDKQGADAVSIGYFEVHTSIGGEPVPVLMELIEDRLSPGDTISRTLEICIRRDCLLIAIESNAYQYSLNYWFQFICAQRGIIGINAVELYSGIKSKVSRILKMFNSYAAGEIFVHDSCKPAVHMQITSFNPLKLNNTDGLLDLLTYAPKVIDEYGAFIINSSIQRAQEFNNLRVWKAEENSPF